MVGVVTILATPPSPLSHHKASAIKTEVLPTDKYTPMHKHTRTLTTHPRTHTHTRTTLTHTIHSLTNENLYWCAGRGREKVHEYENKYPAVDA